MFILYADGSSREGVILSLRGGSMRVAVAGSDDVCEFVLRGAEWIAEDLGTVSFSFPSSADATDGLIEPVRKAPGVAEGAHSSSRAVQ